MKGIRFHLYDGFVMFPVAFNVCHYAIFMVQKQDLEMLEL